MAAPELSDGYGDCLFAVACYLTVAAVAAHVFVDDLSAAAAVELVVEAVGLVLAVELVVELGTAISGALWQYLQVAAIEPAVCMNAHNMDSLYTNHLNL